MIPATESGSFVNSCLSPESLAFYPASVSQQRLWFLDQLQGPTAAYNVHVGLWLYGSLNLTALQLSLQELVNRHETFRTSFALKKSGLFQLVEPHQEVPLPVTDFADFPDPYPPACELAKREVATPFDLSKGPLFRARVMRIGPEEHVLLCTMHHTITDSWSTQIFVKELALAYEAFAIGKPAELPELPIQYGDFSEWQQEWLQGEMVQKQLDYWKETLKDAPQLLQLPQDQPRPVEQSLEGATHTYAVPSQVMAGVRSLATRHQATPFMVLLACFKVLLYRYSGQPDVLVGVPVAGRNQVETEGLIGFFVDTVVLRNNLSGNPPFADLLAQVRESTLAAFANVDVPFDRIVETIQPDRTLSYNPVFQVMFSVIKSSIRSHAFGNLTAFPYVVNSSVSVFDLFSTFIEDSDGKWWLQLDFNTSIFRPERITRMFEDYIELLRGITVDARAHIDKLRVPSLAQAEFAPVRPPSGPLTSDKTAQEALVPSPRLMQHSTTLSNVAEEALLVEIWKDVLGVPNISVHDNFFDVGGHSLLAARVIAQIREATGRKIPVSAIFRAPTLQGLAQVLKNNSISAHDPVLVRLREGNAGVPFFSVAAPGVDPLGLAILAHNMAQAQTVYKLQGPGALLWDRPFRKDELRALAREYVAAMRTVQPHGPYCFGGMCDGVLIAQEMILELESQGEDVGFFTIFDTWVLENSQIRPLWAVDYYLYRLRAFPKLRLEEQLSALRRMVRRLARRNRSARSEWPQTYWPGENFQPPRFRAPVLLFKRPRQPYYYIRDPQMGWGERSTGGIEICEVDCGHFEMLRQPYVRLISERLTARLQEVNERIKTRGVASPA